MNTDDRSEAKLQPQERDLQVASRSIFQAPGTFV